MSRPAVPLLLTGAALLAAGCSVHTTARAPKPFGTAQVRSFFKAATGDALDVDPGAAGFDSLAPADSGERMTDRYGVFMLFVVQRKGAEASMYRNAHRAADGIFWHDTGGSWTAMKRYRNVVLEWITDQRRVDARFQRLDAVLSKLGHPLSDVRAGLKPEDQPCSARGIAPAGGPQGTCRAASGATVTMVDNQDFGAEFEVTPTDAFPLQPGEDGAAALVFDMPPDASEAAKERGVPVFPDGERYATVQDAERLGEIRLGTAPDIGPALHTEA